MSKNIVETLLRENYMRLGFSTDTPLVYFTDKFLNNLASAKICRNCKNFIRLQSKTQRAGIPSGAHGMCKVPTVEKDKTWVTFGATCPEFTFFLDREEVANDD